MQHEPTVFVLDDDEAVRESLKWLVGSVNLNVETFASAQDFFAACTPDQPGCMVLDVRMPDMSGLEVQKELKKRGFTLPVAVLTGFADVTTAVRAFKGGAVEFVEKPFNDQALLELLQNLLRRDAEQRAALGRRQQIRQRLAALTPRERQVLDLVIAGRSNKEIARSLDISPKTVEVHRGRMMEKMKVHSLAGLVQDVLLANGN